MLHKLFQNTEKEGVLSNSFYEEVIITLIPKSEKDKRKENYQSTSLININKETKLQEIVSKIYKKYITMQWGLFQ